MRRNLVTYRVKPTAVAENEKLIREVYQQLSVQALAGFHYATFKMPDGVSFVHLAIAESPEVAKEFGQLPAFKNFQKNIADRCDVPPVVNTVEEIGSFQFYQSH
jgi:hypothetical protein